MDDKRAQNMHDSNNRRAAFIEREKIIQVMHDPGFHSSARLLSILLNFLLTR